jgi:hypothetical protein
MNESLRFTISSGVAGLLNERDTHDAGYTFTFDGDLCQMSSQKEFLLHRGFDVGQCGVYPAVKDKETFDKAITAIWEDRAEGYWHYEDKLVTLKACTHEEFRAALDITCKSRKY